MTSDLNKGITSISYNYLNLPEEIYWSSGKKINYLYNATGQKVQKKVTDGTTLKIVDYLDGFQYAGAILQFFPHGEGYVSVTTAGMSLDGSPNAYYYNYVYNYTDHLGNIRLSYTKDPQTNQLKILEENNYYPFGLKHTVYNSGKMDYKTDPGGGDMTLITQVYKTDYQYKFNGKELQDELGLNLYDFEARGYDPATVRTTTMDPLADNFATMSPYSFLNNNPLVYIDPTGMAADHIYKLDEKTGDITKIEHNDDTTDTLVAENGDVIADNIHKDIFNEAESLNIQENGLSIDNVNNENFSSFTDFALKLSMYTQKEIAFGMYGYTDTNGNYVPGGEFINVLPYGNNNEGNSTSASNIGSGTTLLVSGHTHPSFRGGSSDPSGADRNHIKRGDASFVFIIGRTGTGSYFYNNSTNSVNTLIKSNYSQPFTKEYVQKNLGWKKQF